MRAHSHTQTRLKSFAGNVPKFPIKTPGSPTNPSTYSALPIKPHKTFISGRLNIPGLGKGGLGGVPPQSPRRNRHWLEITRLSLVQTFALRRWQLALANVASTAAAGSRTAACANFSLGQWGSVILFWGRRRRALSGSWPSVVTVLTPSRTTWKSLSLPPLLVELTSLIFFISDIMTESENAGK